MAIGATRLADVIVPEIFDPYMQNITEEKTAIINSGAVVSDSAISAKLAGGGLTFNTPSWRDLANDDEDVMTDDYDDVYGVTFGTPDGHAQNTNSYPKKTGSLMEISVRMLRHQSWTSVELAGLLAGSDPMNSIAQRVGAYWARRRQAAFIALMKGLFADNAAAPTGTDTHLINDLTFDASGSVFQAGLTDFNAVNFLRACLTMGDSQEDLGMVLMHSVVYHKAQVGNLIEFRTDSNNPDAISVPFFLGRRVIIDDGMPVDGTGKVFETWLFGAGAVRFGTGPVDLPSETERHARAGKGAGQDVLHTRVCWCFHPTGYRYNGTAPNGGPSNAATANNLAHLDSWSRVFPERKQIKIARLLTREFA